MKNLLKISLLILLILLIILLSFYLWDKLTRVQIEKFISQRFKIFIKCNNIFDLYNELEKHELFETIFNNNKLKEVYKNLIIVKYRYGRSNKIITSILNSSGAFLLSEDNEIAIFFNIGWKRIFTKVILTTLNKFNTEIENIKVTSLKYKKITLYKILIVKNREILYLAQYKNIFIYSSSQNLLFQLINNLFSENNLTSDYTYLQINSQIGENSLLKCFLKTQSIISDIKYKNKFLYNNIKLFSILNMAGLNLSVENENLNLECFVSTDIKDLIIKDLFYFEPARSDIIKILPEDTINFINLSFNNFENLWRYFIHYLELNNEIEMKNNLEQNKKLLEGIFNIKLEDILFSWLNNEINICKVKNFEEPLILLELKDSKKFVSVLDDLSKRNILNITKPFFYNKIPIQQFKLTSFFKFLANFFDKEISMPYFIIWNDYLIICKDKSVIKYLIDKLNEEKFLYNQNKILTQFDTGNLIFYLDKIYNKEKIEQYDNLIVNIIKKYKYLVTSLKFENNGIKLNFLLNGIERSPVKLMLGWPSEIYSELSGKPKIVKFKNQNLPYILVAVNTGKIYLFDIFGELVKNWPVKINESINTSPFIIDENIGIISENGSIYIWDKSGNIRNKFPIKMNETIIKDPVIFDLNNDKINEIIFFTLNNTIYAIDINGNQINGFPVSLSNSQKLEKIEFFDINNDKKNELVCITASEKSNIFFIDSNGKIIDSLITDISNRIKNCFIEGDRLFVLTIDGKLFGWEKGFKLLKNFPLNLEKSFELQPSILDYNNDGEKDIILISTDGYKFVIDLNGNIIESKKLNLESLPENYNFLDIEKDGIYETLVYDNNTLKLINSSNEVIFSLQSDRPPVILNLFGENDLELLTTKNEKLFLYKISDN